jgi:hypothetical protein
MTVKYGDYSCAKLKPTWKSRTKPAKDADGDKLSTDRGYRGDDPITAEERIFQKSYDPAFDDVAYGKRGDRPNGQQIVQTKTRDPGDLVDHGKSAKGVDADDGSYDHDDGVRW